MNPAWSLTRGGTELIVLRPDPDIAVLSVGLCGSGNVGSVISLAVDDARSLAAALTSWANKVSQVSTQDASAERAPGCAPAQVARSPSKRSWITVPGGVVAEQAVPGAHAIRAQQPAKCRLPACYRPAKAGKHGFCCWAHCDQFADLKAETADQT